MPSISPAGQPWKVESVIWSESARGEVQVAEAPEARRGSPGAGRPPSARASFIASIQPRTWGERMPGQVVADAHVQDRRVLARGSEGRPSRFSSRSMSSSIEPATYSRRLSARRSSWLHSTL